MHKLLEHPAFEGMTIFPCDKGWMVSLRTKKGMNVGYVDDPADIFEEAFERLNTLPEAKAAAHLKSQNVTSSILDELA